MNSWADTTICLLNPVAELQHLAEGVPTLRAAGRREGTAKGSLCVHAELLVFSRRHPDAALRVGSSSGVNLSSA